MKKTVSDGSAASARLGNARVVEAVRAETRSDLLDRVRGWAGEEGLADEAEQEIVKLWKWRVEIADPGEESGTDVTKAGSLTDGADDGIFICEVYGVFG